MKIVAVIPAKMGAHRFPGKPLALIHGVPMVGHIYARTSLSRRVDGVYVAAHDEEIKEYIKSRGGKAVIERNTQKNAPAGVVYALPEIEKEVGGIDWVIMVQGDEPMVTPDIIDALSDAINANPDAKAINVIDDLRNEEEYYDSNIVKVVLNQQKEGMWFFRIPSERWQGKIKDMPIKKQTGVIALRKDFLVAFGQGQRLPVEKIESVDMFRLVENGVAIPTVMSSSALYSVDTEQDRKNVEIMMSTDALIPIYAETYKSKNN